MNNEYKSPFGLPIQEPQIKPTPVETPIPYYPEEKITNNLDGIVHALITQGKDVDDENLKINKFKKLLALLKQHAK